MTPEAPRRPDACAANARPRFARAREATRARAQAGAAPRAVRLQRQLTQSNAAAAWGSFGSPPENGAPKTPKVRRFSPFSLALISMLEPISRIASLERLFLTRCPSWPPAPQASPRSEPAPPGTPNRSLGVVREVELQVLDHHGEGAGDRLRSAGQLCLGPGWSTEEKVSRRSAHPLFVCAPATRGPLGVASEGRALPRTLAVPLAHQISADQSVRVCLEQVGENSPRDPPRTHRHGGRSAPVALEMAQTPSPERPLRKGLPERLALQHPLRSLRPRPEQMLDNCSTKHKAKRRGLSSGTGRDYSKSHVEHTWHTLGNFFDDLLGIQKTQDTCISHTSSNKCQNKGRRNRQWPRPLRKNDRTMFECCFNMTDPSSDDPEFHDKITAGPPVENLSGRRQKTPMLLTRFADSLRG